MVSSQSWASLGLLALSPLAASLPLPIPSTEPTSNSNINPSLEARSPAPLPDPRMIPNKTDLLSNLFAKLGMEELDQFNKLHQDEHEEDNAVIDDSQSTTVTITSHDNFEDAVATPSASVSASPSASASASAGSGAGVTKGQDVITEEHADPDSGAAEEPQGFVDTLFEVLREKFREALNGSDEVTLR
ncbi:hypothetical protein BDV06DRAFT_226919 [Aspergillus oleicola]